MFKAIQQGQLIYEDSSQSKPTGGNQPPRRHLSMPSKDALEVLVEVLYRKREKARESERKREKARESERKRAQLVEDTPHFYPCVGVWVSPILPRHQPPPIERAQRSHQRRVAMAV